MSERPSTIADLADFLVDWNDRAAGWLKAQVEYWDDEPSEDPDWQDVSFRRPELELFMRNQAHAAQYLRVLAIHLREAEATNVEEVSQ